MRKYLQEKGERVSAAWRATNYTLSHRTHDLLLLLHLLLNLVIKPVREMQQACTSLDMSKMKTDLCNITAQIFGRQQQGSKFCNRTAQILCVNGKDRNFATELHKF